MNFLIWSFVLIISSRFPCLETISVDTEDAPSGEPPSIQHHPQGGSRCTSSFLLLDVPLVDSELLELVRSTCPPDPLINTVTSPVRVDLHPVTMVGNFLLSRRNPYKVLFLGGFKEVLMQNGGVLALQVSKISPTKSRRHRLKMV